MTDNKYTKYTLLPGYILFFLMLFVPTSYRTTKMILLFITVVIIFIGIVRCRRIYIDKSILSWLLLTISAGSGFILLGVIHGAPGAVKSGTVYVLWPIIYIYLASAINNLQIINGLFKIVVYASITLSLYIISYLLYATGRLPAFLYIELDQGQAIGLYQGYIEYSLYSVSTLLFVIPFLFTTVLVWPKNLKMPVKPILVWFSLIITLVISILSGRKMVWLILAVSPIISMILWIIASDKFKNLTRINIVVKCLGMTAIIFVIYLLLNQYAGINIDSLLQNFSTGFKADSGDIGAAVRKEQLIALFNGWRENPIFGSGLGAVAEGSIRSVKHPWSYELCYMSLLFHTGIVGFLIYLSAIIWIYWNCFKILRTDKYFSLYVFPVICGSTSFLIGNATNPYLEKFDYLWIVFLPVALINFYKINKPQRKNF